MRKLAVLRAVTTLLTAASMMFVLSGCEEDLKWNPRSSLNVMQPGPEWPRNKKKMNEGEKEIFEKYGRPDYMRLIWNTEGRIASRDELRSELQGKAPKTLPPMTWVYLDRGIEVVFKLKQEPQERPLSDEIRLICRYGDPEAVKQVHPGISQWSYYAAGKMYNISQGRIVSEKDFPAMGGFRK